MVCSGRHQGSGRSPGEHTQEDEATAMVVLRDEDILQEASECVSINVLSLLLKQLHSVLGIFVHLHRRSRAVPWAHHHSLAKILHGILEANTSMISFFQLVLFCLYDNFYYATCILHDTNDTVPGEVLLRL